MSDKTEPVKIPIFVESPYKKVLQTPEIKKMIFIMNVKLWLNFVK